MASRNLKYFEDLKDIRRKGIAEGYFEKKFPAREWVNGRWRYCWNSAYEGAFDRPNILPGDIFDMLSNEQYHEGLAKYYRSADAAIADLYMAVDFYRE